MRCKLAIGLQTILQEDGRHLVYPLVATFVLNSFGAEGFRLEVGYLQLFNFVLIPTINQ